jgi:hypothetical protein
MQTNADPRDTYEADEVFAHHTGSLGYKAVPFMKNYLMAGKGI